MRKSKLLCSLAILSKPTFDEADAPYESNIWLFPYRVIYPYPGE